MQQKITILDLSKVQQNTISYISIVDSIMYMKIFIQAKQYLQNKIVCFMAKHYRLKLHVVVNLDVAIVSILATAKEIRSSISKTKQY